MNHQISRVRALLHLRPTGICLCIALLAAGCSPKGDGDWSSDALNLPKGIQAAELPAFTSRGAQLIATYCSQCHGIPPPTSHSAEDWTPTFRRMILRAENSHHMMSMRGMMGHILGSGGSRRPMGMVGASVPSEEEQQTMLTYLQGHALQTILPEKLPVPNSFGAAKFTQTCSRCHALPNPGLHGPSEWPLVVARMRQHMKDARVPEISEATAQTINAYLQSTTVP